MISRHLTLLVQADASKNHVARHEEVIVLQEQDEEWFPMVLHLEFSYGDFSRLMPLSKNDDDIGFSAYTGLSKFVDP